jgi:hypothetical protein
LRNYFAFPDARIVETDEILPFLETLFNGNLTQAVDSLYPGASNNLIPEDRIPEELARAKEMSWKDGELLMQSLNIQDSTRIYSAAEFLRRIAQGITNKYGIRSLRLVDKIASLNFAWDLLPEPDSSSKVEERVFQSIILQIVKELPKYLDDLEKPVSLESYATVMDPHTYRLTTVRNPVVNINGQFVKITRIDSTREGSDSYYTYYGVDIYGNPVWFINEYSPQDLRESSDFRIFHWDGYIWPIDYFGLGAFPSEYKAP